MKNKTIWIIVIVVILAAGYLIILDISRKKLFDQSGSSRLIKNTSSSIISCPIGCELVSATIGSSNTVTIGNNTYACKCSDGSTTSPLL